MRRSIRHQLRSPQPYAYGVISSQAYVLTPEVDRDENRDRLRRSAAVDESP